MELRDYFITLLVFSAVVIGTSAYIGQMAANYGVPTEDVSSLSVVEEIQEQTTTLEEQLRSTPFNIPVLDTPYLILSGSFTFLKLILINVPQLWFAFLNDLGVMLHLPGWSIGIVFSITVLTLIFEIISTLMKRRT